MAQTTSGVTPVATKIMLIRHAEKPTVSPPAQGVSVAGAQDKESLIVQGWQRAGALAVFFAPSVGPLQNAQIATPKFIYAAHPGGKGSHSERPTETVTPLNEKLGNNVDFNTDFPKGHETQVGNAAMACAGVVLICWEHENIPAITAVFPISTNNKTPVPVTGWPQGRFDVVWVFDLDSTNAYCFSQIPQLLLVGDKPI